MKAAYLDASAFVKLFKPEPESAPLRDALRDWPVQVSSELIRVESVCTARRLDDADVLTRAEALLEQIDLAPISATVVDLATRPFSLPLRAMDAIHLATVLSLGEDVGPFFVYGEDLRVAALAAGIDARAPA